MDLSGIIFVALALGWAVYLIPKALQRNEELARTRAVVTFSDRLRVLGSGRPVATTAPAPTPTTSPVAPSAVAPRPPITRQAAQRAAKRRRVVLSFLVFVLGTVSGLAWFAIAPVWTPAVPGGLILVFLLVARMSVRRQTRPRVAAAPVVAESSEEDTASIDVSALRTDPADRAEAAAEPVLADDGSLWDPVPVTLPTYVTKPTARRTVRTIELTAGITSSGHSAADSELVRQVEAARRAQEAEERADQDTAEADEQRRKAAGA